MSASGKINTLKPLVVMWTLCPLPCKYLAKCHMDEGQEQMICEPLEKQNLELYDLWKVIWRAVFFIVSRE